MSEDEFVSLVLDDLDGRAPPDMSVWLREPENLDRWMRVLRAVKGVAKFAITVERDASGRRRRKVPSRGFVETLVRIEERIGKGGSSPPTSFA